MMVLAVVTATAGNDGEKGTTSAPYKVGDYYNDGIKEGVVFFVSGDGMHGKIVSLDEGFCAWKNNDYIEAVAAATSRSDGRYNMDMVRQQPEWEKAFPAFAWCASLGSGWFLPAVEELKKYTPIEASFFETDGGNDLKRLSKIIHKDHLLIIVSARRGSISFRPSLDHIFVQLQRDYQETSVLLIYPIGYKVEGGETH